MKKVKSTSKFLFSGWRAKRAVDKVEPLLPSSAVGTAIFSGLSEDGESSREGSTRSVQTSWDKPKQWKGRRCPVWLNLVSIAAGIGGLIIALLVLFLYWRPDGWRDDGNDSLKLTLIATVGAGAVLALSCTLMVGCCYCLVCHGEFWQRRKWKRYLDHEEQEMHSMGQIADKYQRAKDDKKARHDAYRTRAYELMRSDK
ncbi:uncharacterized protein ACA1_016010 [Acanthamoeba castellanii str. Neff]|uniref:Transmembrane protein n=1 Tax=Acanthamoeba castellanii (strain ATCC 30010 / Neff) TaxID=1257118 RepID=L8GRY7_ACACF|nr:uncharacterized protein ACA1_016010 [Acanthamoeba castellanii str. Neff]ELR15944.1 hypothetical protein ACA1_016010 [Acanthamoeba castellanii str. Neff]